MKKRNKKSTPKRNTLKKIKVFLKDIKEILEIIIKILLYIQIIYSILKLIL